MSASLNGMLANLGYAQIVPATTVFSTPAFARFLDHRDAHLCVGKKVEPWIGSVSPNASNLSGEVKYHFWLEVGIHRPNLIELDQVVLGATRSTHNGTSSFEKLDQVRAEGKPPPPVTKTRLSLRSTAVSESGVLGGVGATGRMSSTRAQCQAPTLARLFRAWRAWRACRTCSYLGEISIGAPSRASEACAASRT